MAGGADVWMLSGHLDIIDRTKTSRRRTHLRSRLTKTDPGSPIRLSRNSGRMGGSIWCFYQYRDAGACGPKCKRLNSYLSLTPFANVWFLVLRTIFRNRWLCSQASRSYGGHFIQHLSRVPILSLPVRRHSRALAQIFSPLILVLVPDLKILCESTCGQILLYLAPVLWSHLCG